MYEIKLKQVQCPHYAKPRPNGPPKQHLDAVLQPPYKFQPFVSREELSEGIPSKDVKYETDKSKPPKYPTKAKLKREENLAEKIEIYYFDHGSSAWVSTTWREYFSLKNVSQKDVLFALNFYVKSCFVVTWN